MNHFETMPSVLRGLHDYAVDLFLNPLSFFWSTLSRHQCHGQPSIELEQVHATQLHMSSDEGSQRPFVL